MIHAPLLGGLLIKPGSEADQREHIAGTAFGQEFEVANGDSERRTDREALTEVTKFSF